MNQGTRFFIKPTFPIDRQRIRARMWQLVRRSPAQACALCGAYLLSLFERPASPAGPSSVSFERDRSSSLWERKRAELESKAIQELIQESNREQDAELNRIIRTLHGGGHHQYAICLGKFALLKQHIEANLHQDGKLSQKKAEIEQLVDALCERVCYEITQLTQIESQLADVLTSPNEARLRMFTERRGECHRRLQQAYGTMNDTTERLGMMLRPGEEAIDSGAGQDFEVLDRLIERLKEENLIAQRVHEQLTDSALRPAPQWGPPPA